MWSREGGKINEEIISVAVPRLSSGDVILPEKGQGRDAWKWMGVVGWMSALQCEGGRRGRGEGGCQ